MMEIRLNTNNNNNNDSNDRCRYHPMVPQERKQSLKGANKMRPKRDFRFQVIQVHQGPKWFVWPTLQKSSPSSSRRGSKNTESLPTSSTVNDNNNNTNKTNNEVIASSSSVQDPSNAIIPSATVAALPPRKISAGRRQFTKMMVVKRRGGGGRNENVHPTTNLVEGVMTPVTSTTYHPHCPTSEPTIRRMSLKQHKAKTEPLSGVAAGDGTTGLSPSSTFKIISIDKKWDETSDGDDTGDLDLVRMNLDRDETENSTKTPANIPVTVLPTVIVTSSTS